MAKYRTYEGKDIFTLSDFKAEALVEGLLYHNDTMMIAAPPKASKTVFTMQLACSLSSGTPFLDMLDIPEPVKVMYIATEMKDEELKDRFIRTSKHVHTCMENLILICTKGTNFKFNTSAGITYMKELQERYKDKPPRVIVVDSVYKGFSGTLVKDDTVNEFLTNIDIMAGSFDAATILVHHLKKPGKDITGTEFNQSDNDTYGSMFLLGAVDHCIRIEPIRKEFAPLDRYIRCDTQRSGRIVQDFRIRLEEPDPLYFHVIDNLLVEKNDMHNMLRAAVEPLGITQIVKRMGYCRAKCYKVLKELQTEDCIIKIKQGKSILYEVRR